VSYGLKPAGDDSTFSQEVPMVGVKTRSQTRPTNSRRRAGILRGEKSDRVCNRRRESEGDRRLEAPIVFVGYGIRRRSTTGTRVALLFVNEPSSDDPDFFNGQALTY